MNRISALALIALVTCSPACAGEPVFPDQVAVSDDALADTYGTGSWQLTQSTMVELNNSEGTQFLQWVGRNARTQMDVWWGTTGSELVAESVRAASNLP